MNIHQAINLVKSQEPIFGPIIMGLVPVEKKDIPTLGTDGENLFYNPEFLNSLSDQEAAAVVLHECLHCAFCHVWRRGKREQFKFNIATDFAINGIVEESFKLPHGSLIDPKYFGWSAEQIYEALPKNKRKQQGWCDKESWDGQGKGKGLGDKIKDKLQGKKEPAEWEKKLKSTEMQQKWGQIFKESIVGNYGHVGASLQRLIEKQYYVPVIDWASLVANILSEDNSDYNFSMPDRRFLEAEFSLPDMYSYERIKDVVFAYDTSGSVGQDDLRAFYQETLEIFANFSTLTGWAAVCDADLQSFKEITADSREKDFGFKGGGGTSFIPVFKEIEKRGLRPKAVFYFTDLEGSFPDHSPDYPVYWLIKSYVGDSPDRTQVPFGEVIKFLPKQ